MASVNFEKLKSPQEVKSVLRHCDTRERMKHEHNNEHINKDLTKYNMQLKRNYRNTCKLYDERIEMLDNTTNKNKRKDRVTCFGLEIPIPASVSDSDTGHFANNVYKILRERYGDENILQLYVHVDEKHNYVDAETKEIKTSLNHIHAYVIPERCGQLVGKQFSSRANMISLNNAIHEMCLHDFGCAFMDGSKRKSRKEVEELKNNSIEALQELVNDVHEKEQELQEREQSLRVRERKLSMREANIEHQKQILQEREHRANEMLMQATEAQTWYSEQQRLHAQQIRERMQICNTSPAEQETQKEGHSII